MTQERAMAAAAIRWWDAPTGALLHVLLQF
jgi:hypothetical protein